MAVSYVLVPSDTDDEVALADWLEATMLVERRSYMPRARIRKYIKTLFAEDQPDVSVEILLREIARRRRHCPITYPFEEHDSGIKYTQSKTGTPYIFMLCMSVSKRYRDEHRQKDTDQLFDSLVLDALLKYLGSGSTGVRFGAPASGRRPQNFRDAIYWLAETMNLSKGGGTPRKTGGDGGLDVIAWHPFRDRRSGFLVLLAQCTVQRDWVIKAKDLTEDIWRGWIDIGKDPHLTLAIPFVIPLNYEKCDEVRRLVHTVLDRLRLADLLQKATLNKQSEIQAWTASEVIRMGGAR